MSGMDQLAILVKSRSASNRIKKIQIESNRENAKIAIQIESWFVFAHDCLSVCDETKTKVYCLYRT